MNLAKIAKKLITVPQYLPVGSLSPEQLDQSKPTKSDQYNITHRTSFTIPECKETKNSQTGNYL